MVKPRVFSPQDRSGLLQIKSYTEDSMIVLYFPYIFLSYIFPYIFPDHSYKWNFSKSSNSREKVEFSWESHLSGILQVLQSVFQVICLFVQCLNFQFCLWNFCLKIVQRFDCKCIWDSCWLSFCFTSLQCLQTKLYFINGSDKDSNYK